MLESLEHLLKKNTVVQTHLQTEQVRISGDGTQAWVFLLKTPNQWLEK